MTPLAALSAQWPAISALLDVVLDLPAPERTPWLDGLVGEPAQHRDALRALLALQREVEAGGFLDALPQLGPRRSGG